MILQSRRALQVSLTSLAVFIAIVLANRPRLWWQECITNTALYWFIPVGISCVWCCREVLARRLRGLLATVALISHLFVIGYVVSRLSPYFTFSRWPHLVSENSAPLSLLYVDGWSSDDRVEEFVPIVEEKKPSLIVLSGKNVGPAMAALSGERFQYRSLTQPSEDGEISIASVIPLTTDSIEGLGLNAYPGGVATLQLAPSKVVQLGVLIMEPSFSKAQFERNRISTRRLATLMRNSDETRILLANFNATPFSQFTSMYLDQARMRSLLFGHGLAKSYDLRDPMIHLLLSNGLVSRDVEPQYVELVRVLGRARSAIFASVRIPL